MHRSETTNIALVLFALLGFGLVQVYSASYILSYEKHGDGFYYFYRQLAFVGLGLLSLIVVWKMPTHWIEKWGVYLAPLAIIVLFLTLVPGLGIKVGGAKRWLPGIMGVRIEPCEIYKIALPFLLAAFFTYDQERLGRWKWVVRATALGAPLLVFIMQPDFGSFTMCLLVMATVIFVFGFPWKYLAAIVVMTLPILYFMVISVPYRRARLTAFLDPWQDPTGKGFQVIQSMLTFHSGGVAGAGLGDGQEKLFFLPEAHTDFTLAVLGEETGFIGFFLLMCAYGYLVLRGLQISNRVESLFLRVLSLGLVVCFAYSVFINVGVVLGLLPTKGLTLPFLSYGGASLIMSCVLFGILLNIHKQCRN